MIADDRVGSDLEGIIEGLASDKAKRDHMRECAKSVAVLDTTDRICDAIMGVIRSQN